MSIKIIIEKIFENINITTETGIIVASPSDEPDYKYHWIRDSALVMRPIIHQYKLTNEAKYFQTILNYLEIETNIQKLPGISGLGEPKINTDGTSFMGDWGRPQNDGPALRGIVLFKIIKAFEGKYINIIDNIIVPILKKDIKYIIENYNKPSFDLWEENYGWHWYTRMVQCKFLKECITHYTYISHSINKKTLLDTYQILSDNLLDHINGESIISSFNTEGSIVRYEDAANILAYCHIDFDKDIMKKFPLKLLKHTSTNLVDYFRKKYNNPTINLIGRYQNDKYYNGQIWIICSLALAQYYLKLFNINRSEDSYYIIANSIMEKIISLDPNLILPEQFDPNTNEYFSAKKLTWNYSELYELKKNLKN